VETTKHESTVRDPKKENESLGKEFFNYGIFFLKLCTLIGDQMGEGKWKTGGFGKKRPHM